MGNLEIIEQLKGTLEEECKKHTYNFQGQPIMKQSFGIYIATLTGKQIKEDEDIHSIFEDSGSFIQDNSVYVFFYSSRDEKIYCYRDPEAVNGSEIETYDVGFSCQPYNSPEVKKAVEYLKNRLGG